MSVAEAIEEERVLVIPTKVLFQLGYFHGFTHDVNRYVQQLFTSEYLSYRLRAEVEHDPEFKQLIPYVIFFREDARGQRYVFQYMRSTGMGEKRLHNKCSVGVGGHISEIDSQASQTDLYYAGMWRELREEVAIDTPYTDQCVGLINDDTNDVGKVHLGVVHLCKVEYSLVTPAEKTLLAWGFLPVEDIMKELDDFESWSQICMRALF